MIARTSGLSYWYPGRAEPALDAVSCEIAEGAFGLVAGPSAGGKSTFLRSLTGLVPQFYGGRMAGQIEVAGIDPARTPARDVARTAGLVFQEPEAQAVADTVEDEIAFGMEQQGVAPDEMARRLTRLLEEIGIGHLRSRRISTLSGGERQRVAIASVLALEPRLLLLDEPTSQLDPAGADQVIDVLGALGRRGLTILVAEHRLERLLPAAQRVFEVDGGRVRAFSPRQAIAELRAVPAACELGRRLAIDPLPLTGEELRRALHGRRLTVRAPGRKAPGAVLLRARGLGARFGKVVALEEASFDLREGEVVALVGPNGSGKTTLFRALAGTIEATGNVNFGGTQAPRRVQDRTAFAALVPQDPAIALYHETVREEIADTLRARRGTGSPEAVMAAWGIEALAARHPRDISVGQQQRVAIAAMLAHCPPVWLMDEPTRGADPAARAWLAHRLREHAGRGGAAVVATHDIEAAATFATRVIGLADGRMSFDLPVREALGAGGPLPTQVARAVAGAITAGDVVCDGN